MLINCALDKEIIKWPVHRIPHASNAVMNYKRPSGDSFFGTSLSSISFCVGFRTVSVFIYFILFYFSLIVALALGRYAGFRGMIIKFGAKDKMPRFVYGLFLSYLFFFIFLNIYFDFELKKFPRWRNRRYQTVLICSYVTVG